MSNTLHDLKLRYHRQTYGDMTYAEVCKLGNEADDLLNALSPFDVAFNYFAQQRRTWWTYALLLAQEQKDAGLTDHVFVKKYLCAWHTFTRDRVRVKIERTEEMEFHIPRYAASLQEQRSIIIMQLNQKFNNEVSDATLELMEI